MKRLVWLPLFVLLVLLPGCYTASVLEYDGLMPAEVNISNTIHSLTVVSRSDLDSVFKVALVSTGNTSSFQRDSIMAKQGVLGCSDALVESPRFDLFNPVVTRKLSYESSDPSKTLPWDMVRTIAGDPPMDAVLSLESALIDDTIMRKYQDGWQVYQYIVFVKTFWRLYKLDDFQSKDFRFKDTVAFDIDSPSEFASTPEPRLECIRSAMYEAGFQVGKKIAPWWTIIERYYFAVGSVDFYNGAKLLKAGKYAEAAEIWRPYTTSSNKMVGAKACFNMALTCEMANNIPAALEWLKQSEKLGMLMFYILDYKSKLTKRHLETDRLDEQMH
jgi:hypothetical protein